MIICQKKELMVVQKSFLINLKKKNHFSLRKGMRLRDVK